MDDRNSWSRQDEDLGGLVKKSMIVLSCAVGAVALILSGCSASTSSADDADPIHQATAVLSAKYGDSVTYGEVKSVTDQALSATGNPVDDEYRGRAWSAVLKVVDGQAELASVDPMDVMRCASGGNAGSGVELSQVIALCAVSLK